MRNFKNIIFIFAATFMVAVTTEAQTTVWNLDSSHSSIGFSVDHLVISETVGEFNEYTTTITSDKEDFTDASFEVVIQTTSIDTKDSKRDDHLRSPDFFDTEKYPTMIFKGKSFEKIDGKKYKVTGTMTLHGITKEVVFDATFGGITKDPWGGTRAGLKLTGVIDRYDYDLKYNSVLEAGGLAVGKEVRIECRLELIKG